MAQQQEFHPGLSLAGAVDLESLKHQVKAEPGQAGGAPAAGGYVIDTTENTFQAMVQTSATFPILLLLWIPTDDRLFPMARTLGDAVNKLKGQIQLSRIDIASYPSIAQAFQVQGAPALFALIGGRPMPAAALRTSRTSAVAERANSSALARSRAASASFGSASSTCAYAAAAPA